jgi:ubiquitin
MEQNKKRNFFKYPMCVGYLYKQKVIKPISEKSQPTNQQQQYHRHRPPNNGIDFFLSNMRSMHMNSDCGIVIYIVFVGECANEIIHGWTDFGIGL